MALTDNLVSYWKLDESSGDATDSVGGNTLTNNSTVTYSAGKINNAADFDGSTNWLSRADNASLSITGSMSISAWINMGAGRLTNDVFVGKSTGAGSQLSYEFRIRLAGANWAPTLFISSDGTNGAASDQWYTADSFLPSTGTWYHVVGVFTTGTPATGNMYVNGSAVTGLTNSGGATTIFDSTSPFNIGRRGDANNYFHGSVDEVGIWSRVLTGAEVTELYNGGAGLSYPFGESGSGPNLLSLLGVG